jgi:uncharacterized lipoprotein YehR (DUF1307 family)
MNPPQSVIDFIKSNSADHYDFVPGIDKARLSGTKILYITKGDSSITDRDQKFIILNISKNDIEKFSQNTMTTFQPFNGLDKIVQLKDNETTETTEPKFNSQMVNISKIEEEKNTVLKQLEQFSKNYTRTDISEEEEKNIFFSLREKLRNLEAMEYLAKTLDKPLSLKENVADIFTDPSSDNSRTVEDLVGEDFSTENSDWSLSHKKNSMPFPNDTPTTKKSNYLDNKDIPPSATTL